jgi:hypothetical protein
VSELSAFDDDRTPPIAAPPPDERLKKLTAEIEAQLENGPTAELTGFRARASKLAGRVYVSHCPDMPVRDAIEKHAAMLRELARLEIDFEKWRTERQGYERAGFDARKAQSREMTARAKLSHQSDERTKGPRENTVSGKTARIANDLRRQDPTIDRPDLFEKVWAAVRVAIPGATSAAVRRALSRYVYPRQRVRKSVQKKK